jgi:hypothetical protein
MKDSNGNGIGDNGKYMYELGGMLGKGGCIGNGIGDNGKYMYELGGMLGKGGCLSHWQF